MSCFWVNTIEIIAKCKFYLGCRKCICKVICFGSPFRFRRKWYIVILGRPNSNIVTSCVFEHCENKGQGVIVFLITNQLRTIALIYAAWLCQNTTIVFRKLMIRCESHHSIIIVGTYTPNQIDRLDIQHGTVHAHTYIATVAVWNGINSKNGTTDFNLWFNRCDNFGQCFPYLSLNDSPHTYTKWYPIKSIYCESSDEY